jgi:anti-sigma factor RsiW
METAHLTEELSEYLDGELTPAERAAADRHLSECGRCAALLGELRAIKAAAAELTPSVPERDLWPGIRARLSPRRGAAAHASAEGGVVSIRSRHRRVVLTIPELIAAGIAVALLSAALVWASIGATVAPYAPMALETERPGHVVLAAYQPAMTELEAAYEELRHELDPETILVLERNLAIIDAAVQEAMQALEADPSSAFLQGHLAEAMRRRVDLLRQVAMI